jgi:hypothetical protein
MAGIAEECPSTLLGPFRRFRVRRVFVAFTVFCAIASTAHALTIGEAYTQIHKHIYKELGVDEPASDLTENEQYAFVRTYCDHHSKIGPCADIGSLSGGPIVLAFNHDTQSWRVIYGATTNDLDIDKDGKPKVKGRNGDVVIAVIESTNPLFYTAEAGDVTETPEEVLTSIQKLLSAIAGNLPGIVSQAGGVFPGPIELKLSVLQIALDKVKCAGDEFDAAKKFAARVETRRAGDYTLLKTRCGYDSDSVEPVFDALAKALKDISPPGNPIEFCSTEAAGIRELLEMPPTDVAKLRDKQKTISVTGKCDTNLQELNKRVADALDELEAADKAAKAAPTDKKLATVLQNLQNQWRAGRPELNQLKARANAVAVANTNLTTAADLLSDDKKKAFVSTLRDIEKFETRLLASVATLTKHNATDPLKTKEVADFFVVPHGAITVAWDNVRTRTLSVKSSAPFQDADLRRPAQVDTKYSAESLFTSLIDFNASLTYTPLESPVFGVQSVDGDTPGTKKNIIAKTDEERRAGKIALFVSLPVFYRVNNPAARRVGLDIGSGTDTNHPSLFLGLSYKLNNVIRLGVGRTWQEIKALNGQKLGDTVNTTDDIKKKDKLGHDWYASFNFSLGSLKLFQAN